MQALWLHGNHVGPDGAAALAAAPLRALRTLDLRFCPIGPAGAAALAASPAVSRLEALHLHLDDVGAGARALATSPHLPSPLRRLWSAR
ncbi:MAG: hypothetical protein R3F59_20570 [Myxococcota bacterium]